MSQTLREAQRAIGRGQEDRALVLLWNELEPARLAGDRRALATIEALAAHIAREGAEGYKREAERLVEAVGRIAGDEGAGRPATAQLGADVVTPGDFDPGSLEPGGFEETAETGRERQGGFPIGTIVWILIVLAIVVFNVLGRPGE